MSRSYLRVDVDGQVDMSHEEEGSFFTPHADFDVQSEFEVIQCPGLDIQYSCVGGEGVHNVDKRTFSVVFDDPMLVSHCRKVTCNFHLRSRRCPSSGRFVFTF